MGDAILIDIFERVFNRDEGVKIKIKKYFGNISIDVVDPIKPTLRRTRRCNYPCRYQRYREWQKLLEKDKKNCAISKRNM